MPSGRPIARERRSQDASDRWRRDSLHCPCTGGGCRSTGRLPEVRHCAGTGDGRSGGRRDDSELHDMTLRFWIVAALAMPVFLLAMLPMVGAAMSIAVWARSRGLAGAAAGDARRRLGRLAAVCPRRPIDPERASQYVYADFDRDRHGLLLQFGGRAVSRPRPRRFEHNGQAAVYFEAAAMIIAWCSWAKCWSSMRRRRTAAPSALLLSLAPQTARVSKAVASDEVPLAEVQPGDVLRVPAGRKNSGRRRGHRRP